MQQLELSFLYKCVYFSRCLASNTRNDNTGAMMLLVLANCLHSSNSITIFIITKHHIMSVTLWLLNSFYSNKYFSFSFRFFWLIIL